MSDTKITRLYTDGKVRDTEGNVLGESDFKNFAGLFMDKDDHGDYAEFGKVWRPEYLPKTE